MFPLWSEVGCVVRGGYEIYEMLQIGEQVLPSRGYKLL